MKLWTLFSILVVAAGLMTAPAKAETIRFAVTDVEGVDGGGAALEQAVGKSSGAGADIEACHRLDIELKCVQCALEFQAAPTDEAGFFLEFQDFFGGDFFARFIGDAGADFDFSGEDQPLGLFA